MEVLKHINMDNLECHKSLNKKNNLPSVILEFLMEVCYVNETN